MEKDGVKKLGVAVITIVIVALFLTLPVLYLILEAPLAMVAALAVVYVLLSAALIYYAMERFREIEEGLDDAVDDY